MPTYFQSCALNRRGNNNSFADGIRGPINSMRKLLEMLNSAVWQVTESTCTSQ